MATTYRTPIDTHKVIIPYLLTIILFIVHVYEEYITDFEVAMTHIKGFHMLERNFLTVAALVAPILWLTGAIFIMWEYTSFRKNMVRHLLVQAEMVADNCKASVTFDDPKDAENTLNTLRLEPSIIHACIHTGDGKNFASYYRDNIDEHLPYF